MMVISSSLRWYFHLFDILDDLDLCFSNIDLHGEKVLTVLFLFSFLVGCECYIKKLEEYYVVLRVKYDVSSVIDDDVACVPTSTSDTAHIIAIIIERHKKWASEAWLCHKVALSVVVWRLSAARWRQTLVCEQTNMVVAAVKPVSVSVMPSCPATSASHTAADHTAEI